jgi:N-acetylglucosamine-6-sulfatase
MRKAKKTTSRRRPAGALLVAAVICALVAVAPSGGEAKKKPSKKQKRPNIVLVMTDDQTVDSLRAMPIVDAKLANAGVTFPNSFASFPLCCPSRATMLTGQHPDNHGVRTNVQPSGGYVEMKRTISNTLPVWLQSSGYYTAHIGKFLNGYGVGALAPDTEVPPGWSEWYGSLDDPDAFTGGTYTMYGYTLNENGSVVHYGSTPDVVDPATYQTDVYSAKAADYIRRRAPKRKPFYLSVAPLAPHSEGTTCNCTGDDPRAAPRHQGRFAAEPVPRPPSFNEADVSDKPADIRNLPPINATQEAAIDTRYRARLETLLAVDEMVGNLVSAVKSEGELKNTVFIFTSDNGFFHGEHRVPNGKVRHYEESSKVPLIIRGPGIPKNKFRSQLASNIDLAPTILDFANARSGRNMDGQTLLPVMKDKLFEPGRGILIEAFNNADPSDPEAVDIQYSAVRTDRYVYAETGPEQELYDLFSDPFELVSRHNDPSLAAVEAKLDALLGRLTSCAGNSCRVRPALKLKLQYRNGGGCVASGVRARLTGGSAGEVQSASFFARGKAGQDGSAPFVRKIGAGGLSRSRKNRIRANATMLDGRLASVQATTPPRC